MLFMPYLCKALGALAGKQLVTHKSVACHSQAVEEAAVEEVEEFEAIEKLETLGVNRGTRSCLHCICKPASYVSMLALHTIMQAQIPTCCKTLLACKQYSVGLC